MSPTASRTEPRRRVLVPGDVVRVAALVSLVAAAIVLGGLAAALFLLVLGGVMVPRVLAVPTALDVTYGGSLLLAGWAAQLDWYRAVPWLDLPVHAACTGLIAAVAHVALVRWRVEPPADAARGVDGARGAGWPRARTRVVVTTTGLGALVAILWEIGEWAGHTYLDSGIGVGYDDTVGDLVWALGGAVVAGAVLAAVPAAARAPAPPS